MRDRITGRLDDGTVYVRSETGKEGVGAFTTQRRLPEMMCKLAYYEDLEEQGRLIKTPCKVGDTVYYISFGKIYKGKCHAIVLKPTLQIHLYDYDGDNAAYRPNEVFLSKEDAEKALKERDLNA